jgi:hypothetical protein
MIQVLFLYAANNLLSRSTACPHACCHAHTHGITAHLGTLRGGAQQYEPPQAIHAPPVRLHNLIVPLHLQPAVAILSLNQALSPSYQCLNDDTIQEQGSLRLATFAN